MSASQVHSQLSPPPSLPRSLSDRFLHSYCRCKVAVLEGKIQLSLMERLQSEESLEQRSEMCEVDSQMQSPGNEMCLSLLINPSVIYLFVCLVCKMSGNHFLKKPIKHSCIPGLLVLSDQQPETKKNISFTMIQNRKKRHMFAFKELEAIKSRVNDLMQIKMVYLYAINQLVLSALSTQFHISCLVDLKVARLVFVSVEL